MQFSFLKKSARIRLFGIILLTVLSCSTVVNAQPPDCPRAPMKDLTRLAGEWTVTFDYRLDGELIRADTAHALIELAADGCALIEKVQVSLRGQPLAIAKILVAPTSETLQQAYVDSFHGGLSVSQGHVLNDTVRFERSRDWGTHIQLVRHEYFDIEANAFKTESQMSPDNGENWILVQHAFYLRRQ